MVHGNGLKVFCMYHLVYPLLLCLLGFGLGKGEEIVREKRKQNTYGPDYLFLFNIFSPIKLSMVV